MKEKDLLTKKVKAFKVGFEILIYLIRSSLTQTSSIENNVFFKKLTNLLLIDRACNPITKPRSCIICDPSKLKLGLFKLYNFAEG